MNGGPNEQRITNNGQRTTNNGQRPIFSHKIFFGCKKPSIFAHPNQRPRFFFKFPGKKATQKLDLTPSGTELGVNLI
jgi:hypothetical protein